MSTTANALIDLLNRIPVALYQSIGIILYVIGNLGNFISIHIFLKKSWRKNVCAFYFIVCLVCDSIFVNSTMIGTICILAFQINLQNSNDLLCRIFYYVSYVFSTYLSLIFILASIDRLLISSQNVEMRLYSSRRLAYFSLATSFLIWSVFSIHSLIKVGIQELYPTVFVCYYDLSPLYMDFFSYSVLVLSISIPFILILLSVLAFKNVRRVRIVSRQQRKQLRPMTKRDFQLLRCLYVHNIVYICCSVLLGASLVYSRILRYGNPSLFHQAFDTFLHGVASLLHYVAYCVSFFIFVSISKAFRQELKRCIYQLIGKDTTGVREEENQPAEPCPPGTNGEEGNIAVISTLPLDR